MNYDHCPQEARLLTALADGSVPDELREHLEACTVCQDVQSVWIHLREYERINTAADLPSPDAIWWRAQLAIKRTAAQRSIRAIQVMQSIAIAAAIVGCIAVAAWQSSKIAALNPLVLAGTGATLLVLLASVAIVLAWGRTPDRRSRLIKI